MHSLQVRDELNNIVDTPSESPTRTPPTIPPPDRTTPSVVSTPSRAATTSSSSTSAKFKALKSAVSIATSSAFSEKSKTSTSTPPSMYSYSSDSDASVNSLGPNIRKYETRAYARGRARQPSVISSHRFASPPSVSTDVAMDDGDDDAVEVTGFWRNGKPVLIKTPEREFSHSDTSRLQPSRSYSKRRSVSNSSVLTFRN